MHEIYVASRFEAAHRMVGDFGPATRVHGHTYRLEAMVKGNNLQDDGTLYDIAVLRTAVDDLAASLHLHYLNDLPVFENINTTADAIADYCWESLALSLRNENLSSLTVRIWESPDVYAAREDALD